MQIERDRVAVAFVLTSRAGDDHRLCVDDEEATVVRVSVDLCEDLS